jgi:prepilin-type processing-associated H-X9-DG protein
MIAQRAATTGFTLTQLLVVIGVGSVLAGILAADLSQTRMTLLQQACAANMKHWGMAFDLYAQDYNNTIYYNDFRHYWEDVSSTTWTNPYVRYLGGDNSVTSIRTMRICPARIGQTAFTTTYSYTMPIGNYKRGLHYVHADVSGSPFYDVTTSGYFPSFRFIPKPSSFLLLIEGRGNTTYCGDLVTATTQLHVGTGGDTVPAIANHGGGGVNCLFGDFHVEFVSSQVITNQNAVSCPAGNPWFMLN